MSAERFRILFPDTMPLATPYRPVKQGGGGPRLPSRKSPGAHGRRLHREFDAAWEEAQPRKRSDALRSLPARNGVYIEFSGKESYDLITKSLENLPSGIRLLNVRKTGQGEKQVIHSLVYVPLAKSKFFLKRIEDYEQERKTITGSIKHEPLISGIETIRAAMLEAFWKGKGELPEAAIWCEVWLLIEDQNGETPAYVMDRVRFVCSVLNLEYRTGEALHFPERMVVLIKADRPGLLALLDTELKIAEIHPAVAYPSFFMELKATEQVEWVKDLSSRLRADPQAPVSICILDTGVARHHPLLHDLLSATDCHSVEPDWGSHDHHGHGTEMAGVAAYGDLAYVLDSSSDIEIPYCLESAKILPPNGQNERHLWGYLTQQGIALAAIAAPQRIRIGAMAVTSGDSEDGAPTSWSAAIDQLTSGADDGEKCLFVISAGNLQEEFGTDYPSRNQTSPLQEPAQSWNALTVSAITHLATLESAELAEYDPVAQSGELSPYSATSCPWPTTKWPIKPDIVLEGGNVARDSTGFVTGADDLSTLTLSRDVPQQYFTITWGTSAAAMQAARMAAQLQTLYPEAWPETIRGLIVHSAEWSHAMKAQAGVLPLKTKEQVYTLMQHFGYGTPDLQRAATCLRNSLCLVVEREIQPFTKGESNWKSNEVHYYSLPWPTEALRGLEEKPVRLRITLSYFIEPGPGEVGWQHRYRYPSHGLRFDLNQPTEEQAALALRINKLIRDEEEGTPASSKHQWTVGPNLRSRSTVQSDSLTYTGREMADTNIIAVYPTGGWWKERHHLKKGDSKARYSLIVSLHTEETDVDIYTPVAVQVGVPVPVMIEVG